MGELLGIYYVDLTHWGWDKMAAIFQTTFSNVLSSLERKCINFDKISLFCLLPRVPYKYPSIGSDNGLVPIRQQAIIWTNDGKFTNAYKLRSASMS